MNVLITEDNDMLRELVSKVCNETGEHIVKEAERIGQAEAILDSGFIPDVVISDYHLPDGHGPSLFPRILGLNPDAFICLMSGELKEGVSIARESGAKAFAKKPLFPDTVRKFLKKEGTL